MKVPEHFLSYINFMNIITNINNVKNSDYVETYKKLDDYFEEFYKFMKKRIDFANLTIDEATELGFVGWDGVDNLYLFPLWVINILPVGLEVVSLDGEKFKFHRNIRSQIKNGYVAFGLILEK